MNALRLRFCCGSGWDSKIIEWDTRCRWSHVEALVASETASLGAMFDGGVMRRELCDERYYGGLAAAETWAIPTTHEVQTKWATFLVDQIGCPYDWRAILSFGLGRRDWRSRDSWFCSELQASALSAAGLLDLSHMPVCRITPRDVFMLIQQIPGAHKEKS